jgi:hypothetical protein
VYVGILIICSGKYLLVHITDVTLYHCDCDRMVVGFTAYHH